MKCCNGIFILCGLYTENMAPDTIGFIATIMTCEFAFTWFICFTSIYSKIAERLVKQKKTVVMHI